MGSLSRRSCQTNSPMSTAAATNRPTINGEPHPSSAPNEMPDNRATTAGKKIASPNQSKRTRAIRFRLRGTSRTAAVAPNRPKGTLTKKMRRHPPAARSSPPTDGPSARPRAWAAPWIPIARPSNRCGMTSTMMARLFACSIAAPTACNARNPHSAPKLGASPHSTEAKVKTTKP